MIRLFTCMLCLIWLASAAAAEAGPVAVVCCRVEVDADEYDAHNCFVGDKFGTGLIGVPKGLIGHDLSKQIKAGHESKCFNYSGHEAEGRMFNYRQGKVSGIVSLAGSHLKASRLHTVVTQWTQPARSADPTCHPAKSVPTPKR